MASPPSRPFGKCYTPAGRRQRAVALGDGDMAGLAPHLVDPGAHVGESTQVEAAFFGHVGIGVERDVGDGAGAADENSFAARCPSITASAA